MAVYNIAGIPVEYDCRYSLLRDRSEKYKANDETEPEFSLKITDEYLKEKAERLGIASVETMEYLETGTAFYKKLLSYKGMVLHASAVAVDGYVYLFSAPCGTGKSTHTALWQELLGEDRAIIINDDKPAIRKIDGVYYAFGTPFSGKNDISINKGYPLKGICFVRRGQENKIHLMETKNAVAPFFNQTIRPDDEKYMDLLCERVDDILKYVNFYALDCKADLDAARMSYNFMKGDGTCENKASV